MTQDEAFLHAVIESPDDDGPRLMYADWLEERGDPRGEFIRVQCELARLPDDDDRRAKFAARERELLSAHRDTWFNPHPIVTDWRYHRGFPVWVSIEYSYKCSWGEWKEPFVQLFANAPMQELALHPWNWQPGDALSSELARYPTNGNSDLEWLVRCPVLCQLKGLQVCQWDCDGADLGDMGPGLLALAHSQYAAGLASLDLSGCRLEPGPCQALLASTQLLRLVRLNLAATGIELGGLSHLASGPLGHQLSHLDCSRNERLTATGIRSLFDTHALEGLTHLTLGTEGFGEAGVQPLIGSSRLGQLESLRLGSILPGAVRNHPGRRDVVQAVPALSVLLGLRSLARLRELSLEGLSVGQQGLQKLLDGCACNVILSLGLDRCGLDDPTVRHLQAVLNNGRLRRLSVRNNRLTDKGAVALARCPGLARLHELDLRGNDLTPAGRDAIESSPHRHRWLHLLA